MDIVAIIREWGLDGAIVVGLWYSVKISLDNRNHLRYLEGRVNGQWGD